MQMDIETGKTVAEWGFQKDGTDVSMKDLINDSKGGWLSLGIAAWLQPMQGC